MVAQVEAALDGGAVGSLATADSASIFAIKLHYSRFDLLVLFSGVGRYTVYLSFRLG